MQCVAHTSKLTGSASKLLLWIKRVCNFVILVSICCKWNECHTLLVKPLSISLLAWEQHCIWAAPCYMVQNPGRLLIHVSRTYAMLHLISMFYIPSLISRIFPLLSSNIIYLWRNFSHCTNVLQTVWSILGVHSKHDCIHDIPSRGSDNICTYDDNERITDGMEICDHISS